jgi:hypothetical protein
MLPDGIDGGQMKEIIPHKKKKPSQEPSTPEMAFLRLSCKFYLAGID